MVQTGLLGMDQQVILSRTQILMEQVMEVTIVHSLMGLEWKVQAIWIFKLLNVLCLQIVIIQLLVNGQLLQEVEQVLCTE